MPIPSSTLQWALVLGACLLSACPAPLPSPAAALPKYGAADAAALDDGFSGHLFDTAFVPGVAGDDPHFEDRVRIAECIWLVKVATVSQEGSLGDQRSFGVSLRPLESLVGAAPDAPITLEISANDPSFHWLDRMGGAWVGREVLLMIRKYRSGNRVVMHFHGEPNTAELRGRIQTIRARFATPEPAAQATKK